MIGSSGRLMVLVILTPSKGPRHIGHRASVRSRAAFCETWPRQSLQKLSCSQGKTIASEYFSKQIEHFLLSSCCSSSRAKALALSSCSVISSAPPWLALATTAASSKGSEDAAAEGSGPEDAAEGPATPDAFNAGPRAKISEGTALRRPRQQMENHPSG